MPEMLEYSIPLPVDPVAELTRRVQELERQVKAGPDTNALSLMVFSGEMDKLLAAFTLATGAGACGMQVSVFLTFWGTAALKKAASQSTDKSLVEKLFGWMLPGGLHKRKLSKLDMGGLGRWMMVREMRRKRVPDLPALVELAQELGVQLYVCDTSMSLMGIRREELIDYPNLQCCGAAHFLEMASRANTTLFI
jgi:peroxiredoxin family protein